MCTGMCKKRMKMKLNCDGLPSKREMIKVVYLKSIRLTT